MVLVCLPSDALLQNLPSYLGFSYLGCGLFLHGCSSKAQPLLLTLDEGYLLTPALPDLQRGIAPLGPPAPASQHCLVELKWTGMGEFNSDNSDDHYIYYCGQESLRRNGVAIMVNKRLQYLDGISKTTE